MNTESSNIPSTSKNGLLLWWYLFLLLPTAVLKWFALKAIYQSGFYVVAQSLTDSTSRAIHVWHGARIFGSDCLELGLLVVSGFIIGNSLLHIRREILTVSGTFLALIFCFANFMSCQELSQYVSLDTVSIGFHWIRDNPDVLRSWFNWGTLLYLPLAVAWSFGPIFLSHSAKTTRFGATFQKITFQASIPVILLLIVAHYGPPSTNTIAMQGYWSASIASLLEGHDAKTPLEGPLSLEQLVSDFENFIYPAGVDSTSPQLIEHSESLKNPHHIIIVSLETAPRHYYPIVNNPEFPHFYRMSQRAIISNRHYSNSPFTHWASYSILSGLYPRIAPSIIKFGDFHSDGLANVLIEEGYEPTYIDSYKLNWKPGDELQRIFENLGFGTVVEFGNSTQNRYERERKAFDYAKSRILAAEERNQKALIFLDTMLGHHPFTQDKNLSPRENLHHVAKFFDRLFGQLLDFFEDHSLLDDVLVMVTGDHGLRFRAEFDSLKETRENWSLAFNVPFLLYAPGLLHKQVQLPHVTSHVDITPTLLDLVGLDIRAKVHHGESVLNRRVDQRTTFMMNTNLSPVDGFHWNGYFFTYNNLTGNAEIATTPDRSNPLPLAHALSAYPEILPTLHDPREVLETATRLFDATADYQLALVKKSGDQR